MFLQSKSNVRGFSRLGIVLLLLDVPIGMSRVACAEEFEQKPEETIDEIISETVEQESSESIEEITVYGDKSLHDLRLEVYKAEENFFEVFNSVNEDDEFDVRCFYEVPSFTHIRRHVCRANFVTNATSGGAIVFMGADPQYPVVPAGTTIMQKKRRMQEIMESLVAERPELLQALSEYTDKKQTFESEKKNK
jgi:hypothetical protein